MYILNDANSKVLIQADLVDSTSLGWFLRKIDNVIVSELQYLNSAQRAVVCGPLAS